MNDMTMMMRDLEKNYQTMKETEKERMGHGWSCPDGTFTAMMLEGLIEKALTEQKDEEFGIIYEALKSDYSGIRRYIEKIEEIEI